MYKWLKNIEFTKAPSSSPHALTALMVLLRLISIAAIVFFTASACATYPYPKTHIVPIEKFPEFAAPDGSLIGPASADASIPDVDILALNDEIRSILDESVAGIKNPWKRLNMLGDLISKRVKYDTMDDKFGTRTAIETFESGKGNCLSFVNLFVATARYVGLHSGYQDVRTPPNWIRNREGLFVTRHIGAFIEIESHSERAYRIDFIDGNKGIIMWDNKARYLVAPSLDAGTDYVGPSSTRSITDNKAFAQYYNNIASEYLVEEKTTKAYRYFIKAIKTDPELGFAWSNLGIVYSWNNQYDAAEKAYLQGLSINRGRDDTLEMTILNNMARLYLKTERKEEAAYYEKIVASFREKNPYYHFSLGRIAFDSGLKEEAIKEFREAIRRKDDEHLFHYALAVTYIELKDFKNAEKSLKKASSRAWDREQKDYYEHALENLQKTVAEDQKTAG
ncbi:MAG: tetratricopeptide repeat protein [Deltaproteobacteria bacterium]|nr:tetratricopeptide repeat protein [Deltaproteobacteria bacterium]